MPAGYAPLPNPRDIPTDREQELEAAFLSDGEDDDFPRPPPQPRHQPATIPGAYDFERDRDYDYVRPPPGSPPRPSARALPNAIGNSNGLVPSVEAVARPSPPRWGFIRRAVGAVLPTHYTRVPTSEPVHIVGGGGGMMDGVFANIVAKPISRAEREVRDENGGVHMVPEDVQKEMPPSYEAARADAVPPYWETTVHAPGMEFGSEMIVDDLPTGSVLIFVANCFVSFFFQFVGFVMTYLLHTSHAAKFGSRAGLGMTLIQFGFYSRNSPMPTDVQDDLGLSGADNTTYIFEGMNGQSMNVTINDMYREMAVARWITMREWLSFMLMTIGWFLLLTSLVGFWRVKRWERSIRSSTPPQPLSQAELDEELATRQQLQDVFGIPAHELEEQQEHEDAEVPEEQLSEEERLARRLREAGLL